MKTLLFFAIAGIFFSCAPAKDLEMNVEDVQLIKIDTIQRYASIPQQIFTWRSDDNIHYITYEPMNVATPIGARMKVMIRR